MEKGLFHLSSSSALLIQLLCCRHAVTCCHSYSFAPYPPPQEDKGSVREPQWSVRRVLCFFVFFFCLCSFFLLLVVFSRPHPSRPGTSGWQGDGHRPHPREGQERPQGQQGAA